MKVITEITKATVVQILMMHWKNSAGTASREVTGIILLRSTMKGRSMKKDLVNHTLSIGALR